ncbi:hypothetical protein [Methanocaldococcus sp.]
MGILNKIKGFFIEGNKENKEIKSSDRYAIYQYVQTKSGRWRWVRRAELNEPVDPESIEDYPEDGYYQLRRISPNGAHTVLWTVKVEDGCVVEFDPALPSAPRARPDLEMQPQNQMLQMLNMMKTFAEFYKAQTEILKEAGIVKDPVEEMKRVLDTLNTVNRLKHEAKKVLNDEPPDDAPWWAKALLKSMDMLPALAQAQTQEIPRPKPPPFKPPEPRIRVRDYPEKPKQELNEPKQPQAPTKPKKFKSIDEVLEDE